MWHRVTQWELPREDEKGFIIEGSLLTCLHRKVCSCPVEEEKRKYEVGAGTGDSTSWLGGRKCLIPTELCPIRCFLILIQVSLLRLIPLVT